MTLYKPTANTMRLLMGVSLLTSAYTCKGNWFDMDDLFTGMEQQMHQMRQEMEKMQQSMQQSVAQQCKGQSRKGLTAQIGEDQSDTGIVITFGNVQADSVDAQIDEQNGMLRVTTPTTTIKIATRNTTIALDMEEKVQRKQEDTQGGSTCSYFSAQSQSYLKKELKKPIDLEKAKIDYNLETQQLIITISYADESKMAGKKLPVTILKVPEVQAAPIK